MESEINEIISSSPDGQDPRADENMAIRRASALGMVGVVRYLLKNTNVDPSACNNEAVRLASNLEVLSLLLHHQHVDPSVENNEALRRAKGRGRKDMMALLLRHPKVQATKVHLSEPYSRIWEQIIRRESEMVDVGIRIQKKFPHTLIEIFKNLDVYAKSAILDTPENQLGRYVQLIDPVWNQPKRS